MSHWEPAGRAAFVLLDHENREVSARVPGVMLVSMVGLGQMRYTLRPDHHSGPVQLQPLPGLVAWGFGLVLTSGVVVENQPLGSLVGDDQWVTIDWEPKGEREQYEVQTLDGKVVHTYRGPCQHEFAVDVETVGGVKVARLCTTCDTQLPA